jgi:hypothetical protein
MSEITLKVGSRIRGEVDGRPVDIAITQMIISGTPLDCDWVTTTPVLGTVRIAGSAPEPRTGEWAQDASGEPTILRAGSAITVTDPA